MADRPILLIDTCALADKSFLKWLRGYTGIKKISVLTYMEYLTWLLDHGLSEDYFKRLLRDHKIDVEHFTKDSATLAAQMVSSRPVKERRCEHCRQINWNDMIIAAQGKKFMAWIVTENTDHFPTDPSYNVAKTTDTMNALAEYSIWSR